MKSGSTFSELRPLLASWPCRFVEEVSNGDRDEHGFLKDRRGRKHPSLRRGSAQCWMGRGAARRAATSGGRRSASCCTRGRRGSLSCPRIRCRRAEGAQVGLFVVHAGPPAVPVCVRSCMPGIPGFLRCSFRCCHARRTPRRARRDARMLLGGTHRFDHDPAIPALDRNGQQCIAGAITPLAVTVLPAKAGVMHIAGE